MPDETSKVLRRRGGDVREKPQASTMKSCRCRDGAAKICPKNRRCCLERSKTATRRSTRLSLQIPIVVTSLDPTCDFRRECETLVVNAHGFGFISPERIKNETPVMATLVSNGASKKCRVVLAIALLESASWLLGVEFDKPGDFWDVENPPADWRN